MGRFSQLFTACAICTFAWIGGCARGQTIKFIDLKATYTLTESKTKTNPSPDEDILITQEFTDEFLSKTAAELGFTEPPANPFLSGILGHSHGDSSLLAMALRRVIAGSLSDSLETIGGVPVAFGGVGVDISARFKVDAPSDQLFKVSESDALDGRLLTTVDADVPDNEASASVRFATRINERFYRQSTSATGTDHRIIVSMPGRSGTRTVNTPGDLEFMFTAAEPNDSRIHFASDFQDLETVAGQQPFQVTLSLETGVMVIRGGTTALSDFFDTASLGLRAEAVPEPGSLVLLLSLGAGLLMRRQRRD